MISSIEIVPGVNEIRFIHFCITAECCGLSGQVDVYVRAHRERVCLCEQL